MLSSYIVFKMKFNISYIFKYLTKCITYYSIFHKSANVGFGLPYINSLALYQVSELPF